MSDMMFKLLIYAIATLALVGLAMSIFGRVMG